MKQELHNNSRVLRIALCVVLVTLVVLSLSRLARAADPPPVIFRKGEVIVEIKATANIDDVNARVGTTTIQRIYGTYFYRLATPKQKKEEKFRKKLAKDPDVTSAALNPVVVSPLSLFGRSTVGFPDGHASVGQSRSQYTTQSLFDDLPGVHARSTGDGIVVAVIDTGVDLTHPDLAGHLWTNPGEVANDNVDNDGNGLVDDVAGWDFVNITNDPSEKPDDPQTTLAGHGTFIAGLIALVAPGAKIMPLRAFDADGVSDAFTVSQAIKYAADNGAQVINLSFGSPDDSPLLHDAVIYAAERSAVLVAAVGNDNLNTSSAPEFPSNWNQEVIGVAAVDSTDHKADFSNFGAAISVSAPGVRLISLYPQSGSAAQYAQWSGTSFAAPLAVAEAALVLQRNPRAVDIRSLIESTATNIDSLNPSFTGLLGRGRVSPIAALRTFDTPGGSSAEVVLDPTPTNPAARGSAEIDFSPSEQRFEIDCYDVYPRARYRLVVDGVLLADGSVTPRATASDFGGMKLRFSTQPGGDDLPLPASMTPVTRIVHIELRDGSDRPILVGDFRPVTVGTGGGPANQDFEKEARLLPGAIASQASGRAKIDVESEREKLEVEADGLTSGALYRIVADGVSLGVASPSSGYFRIEYTSDGSSGSSLPTSLLPAARISRVQILDSSSRIVLDGTFQSGSEDVGGGDGGSGGGGGGETSFTGVIGSLPSGSLIGDWQVSGRTVHVSTSTDLRQDKGAAQLGAQVEVRGVPQSDGSVNASRVEVLSSSGGGGGGGGEAKFTGTIEGLPPGLIGNWTISGMAVHVSSSTEVDQHDGSALIGATVDVEGAFQADGSVNATKIKVKKPGDT